MAPGENEFDTPDLESLKNAEIVQCFLAVIYIFSAFKLAVRFREEEPPNKLKKAMAVTVRSRVIDPSHRGKQPTGEPCLSAPRRPRRAGCLGPGAARPGRYKTR